MQEPAPSLMQVRKQPLFTEIDVAERLKPLS